MQVISQKQLPQYTGYLSRGLKQALNRSPGEELNGFNIKVLLTSLAVSSLLLALFLSLGYRASNVDAQGRSSEW